MRVKLAPAVILLIVSTVAACSDDVAAPVTKRPPAASLNGDGPPLFHPVSNRYSDNGAKPARGRSGSASIAARALLGQDGATQIEVTTGELDTQTHPGQLTKVQLKSINAAGEVIRAVNFNGLVGNGYWTHTTSELVHNAPIQIQSNVKGIDPKRTDVVTVTATVKKRPDIAVTEVTSPASVVINRPVTITGVLHELNGDLGVSGRCVLLVDNREVDAAPDVWVDAGSVVSCQFSHTFTATGTHTLAVSFRGAVPGEWSTTNNTRAASITVMLPTPMINNLGWGASVSRSEWNEYGSSRDSYSSCVPGSYNSCYSETRDRNYDQTRVNSSFNFSASTSTAAATAPLDVRFSLTSGYEQIGASYLSALAVSGCIQTFDNFTSTWATICVGSGSTSAQFNRNAGVVTYHSNEWWNSTYQWTTWDTYYYDCGYWVQNGWYWYYYNRTCSYQVARTNYSYGGGSDSHYYSYNETGRGWTFGLSSQVTAQLEIKDAAGRKFVAGGTFPVQNTASTTTPFGACNSYSGYYTGTYCYSGTSYYRSWYAGGSGYGLMP